MKTLSWKASLILLFGLACFAVGQQSETTKSGIFITGENTLLAQLKCPTHNLFGDGHSIMRLSTRAGDIYELCTIDYYEAQVRLLQSVGADIRKIESKDKKD